MSADQPAADVAGSGGENGSAEATRGGTPPDSTAARTQLIEIDGLDGEFVATTPDGTRVVLRGAWDTVEVWCQGQRGHFRSDGGCEHADELLAAQSVKRPLKVIPFGGADV